MGNTTEGIILTSSPGKCEGFLKNHSRGPWGPQEGDSHVKAARLAFINDIHKAIGCLNNPHTPIGIKPTLQRLMLECDHYLVYGHERIFIKLCLDAIEVCGRGFSYLSCWISTPQNICYSIYWALKVALERHQEALIKTAEEEGFDSTNDPAFLAAMSRW